jgi:hypothetical protein
VCEEIHVEYKNYKLNMSVLLYLRNMLFPLLIVLRPLNWSFVWIEGMFRPVLHHCLLHVVRIYLSLLKHEIKWILWIANAWGENIEMCLALPYFVNDVRKIICRNHHLIVVQWSYHYSTMKFLHCCIVIW